MVLTPRPVVSCGAIRHEKSGAKNEIHVDTDALNLYSQVTAVAIVINGSGGGDVGLDVCEVNKQGKGKVGRGEAGRGIE